MSAPSPNYPIEHAANPHIRQCTDPACRFRFPVMVTEARVERCLVCDAPAEMVEPLPGGYDVPARHNQPPQRHVVAVLDNIRSAYNVGSIFRSAEGAGLTHLYLCGITATPAHRKVVKTALDAEKMVGWGHEKNGVDCVLALKAQGYLICAIEGGDSAENLFSADYFQPTDKIALVMGNELAGVDPGILRQCDHILAIPMRGEKRSLNVTIAFGIASYFLTGQ